jgi:hypothetical protein
MYVLLRNKLNNITNFLDITKARKPTLLLYNTYTTINKIRPETLCHPPEYSSSIEDIFK